MDPKPCWLDRQTGGVNNKFIRIRVCAVHGLGIKNLATVLRTAATWNIGTGKKLLVQDFWVYGIFYTAQWPSQRCIRRQLGQ